MGEQRVVLEGMGQEHLLGSSLWNKALREAGEGLLDLIPDWGQDGANPSPQL